MKENETPSKGIGFFEAISLILFTLRILGLIEVSWWFVFLPAMLPSMVALVIVVFAMLFHSPE